MFLTFFLQITAAYAVDWARYDHLDPHRLIPTKALKMAIEYFDSHLDLIENKKVITIVDFSKHSKEKRFYAIDMVSGTVEPYLVAHGRNSEINEDGWARTFSNINGSKQSSLGFYLTGKETYVGHYGISLRLKGLSRTNSLASERAIVIHGFEWVSQSLPRMGNSDGCFSLEIGKTAKVVKMLAGKSLLFAYINPEMIENPQDNRGYLELF